MRKGTSIRSVRGFNLPRRRGSSLLIFGLLLWPSLIAAQAPILVPQPRELQMLGTTFRVLTTTRIVVAGGASEDRFAAERVQEELKRLTGRTVPIVPDLGRAADLIVIGRVENPTIRKMLQSRHLMPTGLVSQGYVLDVRPEQVLVAGADAAGVFYGVQTLKQLIVASHHLAEVRGVHIRDWPALAYRGTQVDMSRGPVPKLEYLKRIVRTIAEFKMNQLYLYMEDAFPMEGQPLVGYLDDQLSRDAFAELVGYASLYHVDIIPATEGCGHLHKVLRFEQYAGMAERPHGYDLGVNDPASDKFLGDFYAQLHSVFPTVFYHIGCDETHELGTGRSAHEVQRDGYGKVYASSVNRAYSIVRRYDKQVLFWGDMAVAHPEVISILPKDMIVTTWEYFPHASYEKWIKPFTDAGMKIIICPWAGNTSLIVPNYDVSAFNIANFIDEGKKAGAIGVDVTVWNDDGETLFAPNWWSITYGAANAWEKEATKVSDFDDKFDWVFYGNTDHRFVQTLKRLSSINELLHRQGIDYVYSSDFGGTNDSLFWRDPFSADGQNDAEKILPVASELRQIAEESFTTLVTSENRAARNGDTLKYLEFAAQKLDALGMRYQNIRDVSDRYSAILATEKTTAPSEIDDALFHIQGINGPLLDLRDYTTRLRERYLELWRNENLDGWLPNVLGLYDGNAATWRQEIARFEEVKWAHRAGKALPPAASLGLISGSSR